MKGHNIIREKVNGVINREFDLANYVYDKDVIKNNIEARCRVIRGELLYNVTLGIPLHVDKDDLDLSIMNIVETTGGVDSIKKFTSSLQNNQYHANMVVDTGGNLIEVEV